MIKAVFFDFYWTLCYWAQPLKTKLQKVADRYQVQLNWDNYAAARANLYAEASASDPGTHNLLETMREIVDSYCEFVEQLLPVGEPSRSQQALREQMAWELLQYEHSLFAASDATLYDDVIPTLQQLKANGLKLAIVSNWDTPLHPLTERLGIMHYFDAIVASHDTRVKSAKPDPGIFRYAMEAVGVSAGEVVHVGDTYAADIIGAQGVGIRAILIDRDGVQAGIWPETIQGLAELEELLSGAGFPRL